MGTNKLRQQEIKDAKALCDLLGLSIARLLILSLAAHQRNSSRQRKIARMVTGYEWLRDFSQQRFAKNQIPLPAWVDSAR